MPSFLVISATFAPLLDFFKAKAIRSSVNLLFFIKKSPFFNLFKNEIFRIIFGLESGKPVTENQEQIPNR